MTNELHRKLFTLDMIEGARLGEPEPMKPSAFTGHLDGGCLVGAAWRALQERNDG